MGLRGVDFGEEETSLSEEGPTRREGGREEREAKMSHMWWRGDRGCTYVPDCLLSG